MTAALLGDVMNTLDDRVVRSLEHLPIAQAIPTSELSAFFSN